MMPLSVLSEIYKEKPKFFSDFSTNLAKYFTPKENIASCDNKDADF